MILPLFRYYRAQIGVALALQLQYRFAVAIWMIGLILEPVIYLAVWTTVARASGGAVGGFSAGDFAAYYLVLTVVMHLTQIWHMWEYEYLIRQGMFSPRLLRPIHPIHADISENIAYKVFMLVVLAPALAILALVFRPVFEPPLWALAAFVPAILLAALLAFIVGWIVALAAFWATRTMAINQLYYIAMFFFSGQVAPLALLPPLIQTVANLLPFRWWLAFPVELLLGRLTQTQALEGFAAQLVWIAVAVIVLNLLWRAAVRRYGAVGG